MVMTYKTTLSLAVILPAYDPALRPQLDALGLLGVKPQSDGSFSYMFSLSETNIPAIEKIFGIKLEVDADQLTTSLTKLLSDYPVLSNHVTLNKEYGKGKFEVELQMNKEVNTYKITTIQNKKEHITEIPYPIVEAVWQFIRQQPLATKISCVDIASDMADRFGFKDKHSINDHFSWSHFFGERQDYFTYYYYPLKVLQYDRVIDYKKNGVVIRIADNWRGWWKVNLVEDDTAFQL